MSERESREGQPDHERRKQQPRINPRIWIGSLADYNNGRLTGDWVDAAVEDEEILAEAKRILATSETPGAEEWVIFDYDKFGDFKPEQFESLEVVARVARGIAEHGLPFAAWAQLHDADEHMLAAFEDSYLGEYDSVEHWADDFLAETGAVAQLDLLASDHMGDLAQYVKLDVAAWAHDAWLSGDIHVMHNDDGRCWIFTTR